MNKNNIVYICINCTVFLARFLSGNSGVRVTKSALSLLSNSRSNNSVIFKLIKLARYPLDILLMIPGLSELCRIESLSFLIRVCVTFEVDYASN